MATGLSGRAGKHLLLIGGGHAHLSLLERLAAGTPAGWAVTLVSPYARQNYSGMLPGWAAGRYAIEDCAISLADLAARAGIGFHRTAATALDLARHQVQCADGQRLPFDLLSIDTGAEPAIAGLAGAAEHAVPVRPIEGFVAAWPGVVERWQVARAPFELVIVGSGAAAVELAFAARQRAATLGGAPVNIHLVGREPEPLDALPGRVRRQVLRLLLERGIRWWGERTAVRILPRRVVFAGGETLDFDACLAATGPAAPRWPREAGLATDEHGFVRVDAHLRSVSHPEVYAAGDVAALAEPRPKSGVFAVRAGPVLAANLLAACAGAELRAWQPQRRALQLISTGDGRALASWGAWSACGRWVWRWKDGIDRRFVQRFRG